MDWRLLPLAIVAAMIAAHAMRDGVARGVALTLALNWSACALAAHSLGEEYPAEYFLVFDWLSAVTIVVLIPLGFMVRATAWQGAIGLLYAGEILCHVARLIRPTPAAIYYGYYFLKYAAWAQVLVVGGWMLYALACRRGWTVGRLSRHDSLLGGYIGRHARPEGKA